jgi:hypothetical protein
MMEKSESESERSGRFPRSSPHALRESEPYFGSDADVGKFGRLEREAAPGRKSFWECDAEYNPLGKFGASWSRI